MSEYQVSSDGLTSGIPNPFLLKNLGHCQNCGRVISVQIFKGTEHCSENCRKETLRFNGISE